MILVLASRGDAIARNFARLACAAGMEIGLVAPDELSRPGWSLLVGASGEARAVVAGKPIPVSRFSGVLCRLSAIHPSELVNLVPQDREYVAAEMSAFLLAWLDALQCPVVNRPSPISLSGPGWRPEQWLHAASRLGIPVAPSTRRVPTNGSNDLLVQPSGTVTLRMVGSRCIDDAPPDLLRGLRRLAAAADVTLLVARFAPVAEGHALIEADCWPDLSQPRVAAALVSLLTGASR